MSLRPSFIRLAQHARQPLMKFPDRKAQHASHDPEPHPCAPKEVVEAFSRFSEVRANPQLATRKADAAASSSYGGPTADELKRQGQGQGSGASSGSGQGKGGVAPGGTLESESQLPAWLRRDRYAPTEEEIDAVMSGGATSSREFTKQYQKLWYTAQY
ncbi:hypothetical protein BMF94_3181 [Rhodotorula taiwanensis]|uniref:Uncharacterized protein n=1 Tax=Rhodotorula taiwanensis TaxID=741276 RepID=A0A2S5BA55_9BASI|nr:hypothetical protein BMF94_3181 [Rhodotorula taiwanensis]